MTSLKQIMANQLNSKKSTGPKSDEGKTTVSQNAVKHGLLSNETILPWENELQLVDLRKSMFDELQPIGGIENILVDRLVSITWRLRRAGTIESGIYAWRKYSLEFDQAFADMKSHSSTASRIMTDPLESQEIMSEIDHEYDYKRAVTSSKSELVNSALPALGRSFVKDADIFITLSRYEGSIERSFFKILHELQRIQAARSGNQVSLPLAIDFEGDLEL